MKSVRTCLGCRQRATSPSLLRVVVHNDEIVVDHSTSLPGRGAWVHPSLDCVDTAITRKAFGRALRNPDVAVDGNVLRQAISHHPTGTPSGDPSENGLNGPVKMNIVTN